jgi:hypothetical protein
MVQLKVWTGDLEHKLGGAEGYWRATGPLFGVMGQVGLFH